MRALLAVFFSLVVFSRLFLEDRFQYPFIFAQNSGIVFPMPRYGILDLINIITGNRRLGSDIAWIQTLQYYGTSEEEIEAKKTRRSRGREYTRRDGHAHHDEHTHPPAHLYGGGKYEELASYCRRVTWLDPYFQYAYLYGAASLAWNLKRPDEALELLDFGINNYRKWRLISPRAGAKFFEKELKLSEYWQLEAYRLAIVYKKLDRYKEMVDKLEEIVKLPGVPVTMKAILANIHKKAGNHLRALQIWVDIYESGPGEYTDYAKREITFLRSRLGI